MLDSLYLTDGVVESRLISIDTTVNELPPGGILMIMDPDYFTAPKQSAYAIPADVILSKVEQSSICGGLTETDGFAILYGAERRLLSLFSTSHSGPPFDSKIYYENSEEKDSDTTSLHRGGLQSDLFESSLPSPGRYNYLDAGFYFERTLSSREDKAELFIQFLNFSPFPRTVSLHNDETVLWQYQSDGLHKMTLSVPFRIGSGEHYFRIAQNDSVILDTLNLSALFPEEGGLHISEVAPRNDIEWVELYNSGSRTIHLQGYALLRGEDTTFIPQGTLEPESYLLLSSYSAFLPENGYVKLPHRITLDNYRDTLCLLSPVGVVDSLTWDYRDYEQWNQESINNIEGAMLLCDPSPGTPSTCTEQSDVFLSVSPQIIRTSLGGTEGELSMVFGPKYGVEYRLSIYDLSGLKLFEHMATKPDTIRWNGIDRHGRLASRGPVFILLESGGEQIRREAVVWPTSK